MNRRNAVIRALATVTAAMIPANAQDLGGIQSEVTTTPSSETLSSSGSSGRITLTELSRHQSVRLQLADESDKDSYGITHIAVGYRGRMVSLSAKEIMEALEGK